MMLFGIGQLRNMPVDVFPEFAPPPVQIQTACLGLTAAEVETLVTVPLEQALDGIAGLDVMRSKSVAAALADVELIFKLRHRPHARPPAGRRSGMATVPEHAADLGGPPIMLQPLSATSRVMKIGISSRTMSRSRTCR